MEGQLEVAKQKQHQPFKKEKYIYVKMTSTYLLHVYGTSWHGEIQAAPSHGGIIANTFYCKNCMFFSPRDSFQLTGCHSSGAVSQLHVGLYHIK